MDNASFLQSVGTNFDRASGLLGLSDDLALSLRMIGPASGMRHPIVFQVCC